MTALEICFIGSSALPGVFEAAKEAGELASKRLGCRIVVRAFKNLCYVPHIGLGNMRNFVILEALRDGTSHLLMMDTDVLFTDAEVPMRLMEAARPNTVIVPFFTQPKFNPIHRVSHPQVVISDDGVAHPVEWMWQDGQSDKPPPLQIIDQHYVLLQWAVFSCMMFDCRSFAADCLGPVPFTEMPIIRNEEYHALRWAIKGVKLLQDTQSTVELLRPPATIAQSLTQMADGMQAYMNTNILGEGQASSRIM